MSKSEGSPADKAWRLGDQTEADRDLLARLEFVANETHRVIPEEIEEVCDLAHARIVGLLKSTPPSAEVPLCAGHADMWFTGRNHLKGDTSCVVCAFRSSESACTPLGWVTITDKRVSDPVYRTREAAEQDAELLRARGIETRVAGVYLAPPSATRCEGSGGVRRHPRPCRPRSDEWLKAAGATTPSAAFPRQERSEPASRQRAHAGSACPSPCAAYFGATKQCAPVQIEEECRNEKSLRFLTGSSGRSTSTTALNTSPRSTAPGHEPSRKS
jgi:hypothetical protein